MTSTTELTANIERSLRGIKPESQPCTMGQIEAGRRLIAERDLKPGTDKRFERMVRNGLTFADAFILLDLFMSAPLKPTD